MLLCKLFRLTILDKVRQYAMHDFKVLSVIFLHLLFVSLIASPAIAQQKASERIESLRTHFSRVEADYAKALASGEQNVTANLKVEDLREELRGKFKHLVENATSSEAKLAILRADVEAIFDAIRAYETTLAAGPGEFTSYLNVFSEAELANMHSQSYDRLNSLKLDRLKIPPEQVSLSLEFRIREVQGWYDGLAIEIDRRRTLRDKVQFKSIPGNLTVDEARTKYAAIGSADGNGGEHFQRKLAYQIQIRLQSAPQDAALKFLESSVPEIKPPDISSSIPRGPPESVQVAEQQLRAAHIDELTAVTRRDSVNLAKARARAVTYREWIAMKFGNLSKTDKLGLSVTSTEHLLDLRGKWKNWHGQLFRELQARPDSPLIAMQLKEAEVRFRDIDVILEDRHLPRPPPNTDGFNGNLPDNPSGPDSPNLRALERAWERQIAHIETVELGRASNQFSDIIESIPETINKTIQERFLAEAKSLNTAFGDTIRLQRDLFITGRGPEAAEAGKQLLAARENIQAAASELLDSLSTSKPGTNRTLEQVKALVGDFARTKSSTATSYSRALISLEHASETLKSSQRSQVEIHAVSPGGSKPVSEQRIQLRQTGNPPKDSTVIKRPSEFKELYPRESRPPTVKDFLKNPQGAPGGIIFDASLPEELARRIQSLNVDTSTGLIKAKIADVWLPLKLRNDPLLARLAWGFVLDGQSAVIDLRPLKLEEASWFVMQYGIRGIFPSQMESLIKNLMALTSVNINDALQNTMIGPHLISADQLMFDLLPNESIRVESHKWAGLPIDELRRAFRMDAAAELNNLGSKEILFKKSLLAVSATSYEEGTELIVSPQFSFHLFGVPSKGDQVSRLKECERWFNAHQRELQTLPQLSRLSDFAAMVTLFRSVRERNIENNMDELIVVPVPTFSVPRYLVRKDHIGDTGWEDLRTSLSSKEN